MKKEPVWKINSITNSFKALDRKISVDVAIIGGGITGITCAQLLKSHGFKVAVLESRKIGEGTTGQSTGNLYGITEYPFKELLGKYDLPTVQQVVSARIDALNLIRENVNQFHIDCDLQTRPMYLFKVSGDYDIQKELETAQEIGLPATALSDPDFPFEYEEGIHFENFAQFNPLTYTQQLAREIYDANCEIYEDTCVEKIEKDDDFVYLHTKLTRAKAKFVIHATHTPKGLQIPYHTTLGPYREYGIAVKLKNGAYPEGIFWGHFKEKKVSIRSYGSSENPFLIIVGSMHKVGQEPDNTKNIEELIAFAKNHFDVESVVYEWGGQNYKPADLLPYIGEKNSGSKEYIATGFSTDGLIYGTLAAKIISDHIAGIPNEYAEIFKASRHQPFKAAAKFVKENLDVAGKLIGDYFKKGADKELSALIPGEGKLIQLEDGKYAVSRNTQGKITVLSPICPHMGCTVHWNKAEKSWDCPCHGSRFDTDGKTIEGPALTGLEKLDSD